MVRIFFLMLFLFLFPGFAFAYIDPGVVPMLFQAAYAIGAGLFLFLFVVPLKTIKEWLFRKDKKNKASKDE